MEDTNFSSELSKKLHQYYEDLEKNLIPSLKNELKNFHSMMANLMKILLKKGLIIQDPYKYDEKLTDIEPVSTESFPDSERLNEMSTRLAQFMTRLDYLNNYVLISVDSLDFNRIKSLLNFLKFINWENLSLNHTESNQRSMAYFVSRAQTADDPLTTGLVRDCVNQLNQIQKRLIEHFKRLTFFKREEYKAFLRSSLENTFREIKDSNPNNFEESIKIVRKDFTTHIKGQPFIPELVKEILLEDDPHQGPALRSELLKKLTVELPKKKVIKTPNDFRPILLETLRQLSNVGPPLESAKAKLVHNSTIIEEKQGGFGSQLSSWFRSIFGRKNEPKIYEVEIYDTQVALRRPELLDFDQFILEVTKEIKILGALGIKNSTLYLNLTEKPDKEIVDFVNTHFIDLSKIAEKILALDEFFKVEVPKPKKNAIKGTKLEVMQIKTFLSNANKNKLEYLSAVEEIEQLKRLGIKMEQ